MTYDPRYLRGIDHFNRREFFEAHEVWEDLWIEVNGDRKAFYQGLIQAAVALHHALRDNYGGAESLYRRMCNNLDAYRPGFEGLDVDAFLARMAACCGPALERRPIDPKAIPTIALAP